MASGRPWTFTDRHADLGYADYYESLGDLGEVDWSVMPVRQWGGDSDIKERRQAEFLVHERFPWDEVEQIAVINASVEEQVCGLLEGAAHVPETIVQPSWYY